MTQYEKFKKGLAILEKYGTPKLHAEHDQIFSGITLEELPYDNEDVKELEKLGWFDDCEEWCFFT